MSFHDDLDFVLTILADKAEAEKGLTLAVETDMVELDCRPDEGLAAEETVMGVLLVERCRECRGVGSVGGKRAKKLYEQGRTVRLAYCPTAYADEVDEKGGYMVHDILVYVGEGVDDNGS